MSKPLAVMGGGSSPFKFQKLYKMKKTSVEWLDSIPKKHKLKLLDPDGWDRQNFEYSFNEELITREEFDRRLCSSTIKCNYSFFE